MNKALKHSALAWALIGAQMLFVVLGHGRVVVCYDDTGSSHIQLLRDVSSVSGVENLCGQPADGLANALPGICIDTQCVDELFGLTFTVSSRRGLGHSTPAGLTHTSPPAMALWSPLPEIASSTALDSRFADVYTLSEQRIALRTTVLIL